MVVLLSSLLVVCGRATYRNLSRYSGISERTYRRQMNRGIGLEWLNQQLIASTTSAESVQVLSVDCTFVDKSGRATPDLDRFYNSNSQRAERGLEWSVVAVVDVEQNTAYALSAQQTAAGLAGGESRGNRVDFYLGHLAYCQPYVPARVKHVVGDSFYSKRKWVDGVCHLGWQAVGKLRHDANLKYLDQGPRRSGPGRQPKYAGKVDPRALDPEYCQLEATLDDGTQLWSAKVWSVSLARVIRLVCLIRRFRGALHYALLFSTDVDLSAAQVLQFYRARFQIEFVFRDAKQFTGMGESQSRNSDALDAHINASLTALNLAKAALRQELTRPDQPPPQAVSFSIASFKRRALNEHLLLLFAHQFGLDPTLIKSHPNYQNLLHYGSLVA